MHRDVLQQADLARLDVDLDDRPVRAERPCHRVGIEVRAAVETRLAHGRQRLRAHGGRRHLGEVETSAGHSSHRHAAVLDPQIFGGALEHRGGDQGRPAAHLARRAGNRGPGVGGHAAGHRADPVGKGLRVGAHDLHRFDRDAELLGADLGQRRRVALALGRHPDEDVHRAAGVHAHVRAFVRPQPRALQVAGDADAETADAIRTRHLERAVLVVPEELERLVERRRKVGGVVADRRAVLVFHPRPIRHLVGADEIPAPDLRGIEAELPCADVEHPLEDEGGFGTAGAPVGGAEGLVRHHVVGSSAVVADSVRRAQVMDRVEGNPFPLDRIGPHVGREVVVDGRDDPVAMKAHADRVDLLPIVTRRDEVLAPRLHPLHGAAQTGGHERHQHLFLEDLGLGAERSADLRSDDPDPLDVEAQHGGDRLAHEVGRLGGGVDDEDAGVVVPRQDPARLHRHGGVPRVPQLVGDHEVSGGHGFLDVTDAVRRHAGDVVRPRVVETGRGLQGLPGRHDGGHRLVLHVDSVDGVLELGGGLDDDDGHRLAHVSGLAERERTLFEGPHVCPEREMRRNRPRDLGKLGRTEDPEHAGERTGVRRIDGDHSRVGVRAADDPQVHQPRPRDVVEIPSSPAKEREVLAGFQ